jgi:hypothetical protein
LPRPASKKLRQLCRAAGGIGDARRNELYICAKVRDSSCMEYVAPQTHANDQVARCHWTTW